jgi:hypothetical protein
MAPELETFLILWHSTEWMLILITHKKYEASNRLNYLKASIIFLRLKLRTTFHYLIENRGKTYGIWRILVMVYNAQNYWGCGFCPSSRILKNIKHNGSPQFSAALFPVPSLGLILLPGAYVIWCCLSSDWG